jgi:putative peptidoglycan lipid II flippase
MTNENTDIKKVIQRASLLMMVSVILSRVIGFLREWVLAQTVGATPDTDVYWASFTIPDFLNYLMAAGALSISFIPILATMISEGNEDLGRRVFRSISTWMGLALILFIIVGEIFASTLADLVAPGFGPEQHALLVTLLRIILPAQFFFYWGGLAISVQHTHGKFFLPAVAPIIYNGGIIIFGILLHRNHGVLGFSVGVLAGAFLSHGILQWIGVRKVGFSAKLYFEFPPEVSKAFKRYLWLNLPIMLGFSLVVTDEWFSKYFGSRLEPRAVSWLSYARTEMRIPIAILGQAAGIASFPYLSRLWSQQNYEKYAHTLLREIQKLWALAPVAAILLMGHALPLTQLIYGGGKFTERDFTNTAGALQMFGIGVFFWTVQVLLSRGFYAAQKTWLPSLIGTIISVAVFPFYAILGDRLGFKGLALTGSIGIAVYTAILWVLLRRHIAHAAQGFSFAAFYKFCFAWCVPLVGVYLISEIVRRSGIYQSTRLTAFADIMLVGTLSGGFCLVLLRKVYFRMTDGALF